MAIFKESIITKDILSNLMNYGWECYRNNKEAYLTTKDLRKIHDFLIQYKDGETFGKLAEEFNFMFKEEKVDPLDKIENNLIGTIYGIEGKYLDIDMHKERGFILHDQMEASAFGRSRYIYRAKGSRYIWFENGIISMNNVYVELDENRCFYSTKPAISSVNILINDIKTENVLYDIRTVQDILLCLSNIQKNYIHDYPLEYIMNPPDVYKLSDFSLLIREDLWKMLLDLAKDSIINENLEEQEAFLYYADIFNQLSIEASSEQILAFFNSIKNISKEKLENLISLISSIQFNKFRNESLTDSIIHSMLNLQNLKIFRNASENERNTYIRDILTERRYDLKIYDQSLRGLSGNMKASGETDFYIEDLTGNKISYIEALNLDSIIVDYINEHINRIWNYDTSGLKHNYILIYYDGKNFTAFWEKYLKHIQNYKNFMFPVISVEEINLNYSEIVQVKMRYQRNNKELELIHICVNMN